MAKGIGHESNMQDLHSNARIVSFLFPNGDADLAHVIPG